MKTMNDIHIRSLDVTLILIVEALLRKRNMSAVAAEMGLTQSAISHAVSRLRGIFGDPLFVRKGAGVEPTPRALQIGPMLVEALGDIRAAAAVGRRFDPAVARRGFTVAAPDTIIMGVAPKIVSVIADTAPLCQINFRHFDPETAASAVASGEVDFALGRFATVPKHTISVPLLRDTFTVAARPDHPRIPNHLDLATYCALDHLLVGNRLDERGMVDVALAALGLQRRVIAIMPQLSLALAVASRSNAIITAPLSACRSVAPLFHLTLHDHPLDLPDLEVSLLSHRDVESDPALCWLRDLISQLPL